MVVVFAEVPTLRGALHDWPARFADSRGPRLYLRVLLITSLCERRCDLHHVLCGTLIVASVLPVHVQLDSRAGDASIGGMNTSTASAMSLAGSFQSLVTAEKDTLEIQRCQKQSPDNMLAKPSY